MDFGDAVSDNLSGSLLIAHPTLIDPNFKHSVILVSADSPEDGTLGVVINKPMGKTLGQQSVDFAIGTLADVPIYMGGPVQTDQILLTAWHWQPEAGIFRMYFGISEDKAKELLAMEPATQVRAFLGYSGWGKGQLEHEREQNAWLISPVSDPSIQQVDGDEMWREMIGRIQPELLFLANLPEDPSLN